MVKSFENYTRLAGSHGRRGSLWRGPDHLLVIEGRGLLFAFSEHYRRIDYANIQALTWARTSRFGWLAAAIGLPTLLLGLGVASSLGGAPAYTVGFGGAFAVFLGLLIWHVTKGRTLRCSLQTAVQSLRLRPLRREPSSRMVLQEIAELCRMHQSDLPPLTDGLAPPPLPSDLAPPAGTKPLWQGSPSALAAGALVFLWGLTVSAELFVGGSAFLLCSLSLGLLAACTTLVALVLAMRHRSPLALLVSLWMSTILAVATGFAILVCIGIAAAILERTATPAGPMDAFAFLSNQSLSETGPVGWIVVGLGALIALLGLVIFLHGQRKGSPPTKPAERTNAPPSLGKHTA
ncbi:MAG: hypothetical protein ACOYMN_10365 [Roseimicrobium sp.]